MTDSNFTMASQVRMARAALRWQVKDLAEAAQVSANTVVRLEKGLGVHASTQAAIRRALESAGVRFIHNGVQMEKLREQMTSKEYAAYLGHLETICAFVKTRSILAGDRWPKTELPLLISKFSGSTDIQTALAILAASGDVLPGDILDARRSADTEIDAHHALDTFDGVSSDDSLNL